MSNDIKLMPISKLLDINFFIPSYQRGYRWTEQQVNDLLNDIDAFTAENESWYCLQPLVIKKISDKDKYTNMLSGDWFEVIDGQQRITTIDLFIHYFNEMWVGKIKVKESQLKYETREKSSEYLQNIEIDTETNTVKVVDVSHLDNIDFYHISEAYQTIHNWAIKKGSSFDKNKFQSKFIYSTQVIWYEIKDNNSPIDTFIRINMGKIPLTNSELIKALFLQKRNFNDSTAELRQIEIASEWDRMEYALQSDDFWWFLNKERNEISARIEFLFDLMCAVAKKDDDKLQKRIGTDHYETFRFFNEKFSTATTLDTVKEAWNEVKDYFLAFEEWFNEPIWYHYVGYLIYCGTPIVDIYNLYKGSSKDAFLKTLKVHIKDKHKNIYCEKLITENNTTTYTIDLPFENKNKQNIRELQLLFNIEYIVKQYEAVKKTENVELFIRFPFELFKKENWDIEHIDSFTENEIKEKSTQKEWLENSMDDLADEISEELKNEIQLFLDNDDKAKQFVDLKFTIVKIANEDENNEDVKNTMGNLTLLDFKTNRSYGNALFPTKRRIIIEKDTAGKFVPICTKNVFLKYFAKKVPSLKRWSNNDIVNYQNHMGIILTDFLTFKTVISNEQ